MLPLESTAIPNGRRSWKGMSASFSLCDLLPARRSIHFCLGFAAAFFAAAGSIFSPVNCAFHLMRAIAGGFGHTILLRSKATLLSSGFGVEVCVDVAFLFLFDWAGAKETSANISSATNPSVPFQLPTEF